MTKPPEPVVTGELKVTQDARDAAAKWAKSNSRHAQAANIKRGSCDDAPIVKAFASFERAILARTANALPGDVGMREALADVFAAWDAHAASNDRTNEAIPPMGATRAEREVYAERYKASEEAKRDWFAAMHRFVNNPATRAALAPSALSGDAGDGE